MEILHTNGELVTRTQGTGVDVVFLHGWGMNSGAFTSFIPYLSDNFRVTTIDLPSSQSITAAAERTAAVADLLSN